MGHACKKSRLWNKRRDCQAGVSRRFCRVLCFGLRRPTRRRGAAPAASDIYIFLRLPSCVN